MTYRKSYDRYNIRGSIKELRISLDNFNPLDPNKRINSFRSIKICKQYGIALSRLFHTSYQEVQRQTHPLQRLNDDYITAKYIEIEAQRQNLVAQLKTLRKRLIQNEVNHNAEPYFKSSRRNSSGIYYDSLDIGRSYHVLDKSIIRYEKEKVENNVRKEIKILVNKAKANLPVHCKQRFCFTKNSDYTKTNFSVHTHSTKAYFKSTTNNTYHLRTLEDLYENNVKKVKRKLTNSVNEIKHNELKEIVNRVNEHDRELLIGRIRNHRNRIENLKRQREELAKLRQNIRKNAAIKKYIVKSELEKSMILYKVLFISNCRNQR